MPISEMNQNELVEASKIAFAMVRFAEGAAHPARGHTPQGVPRLGQDVYSFTPSARRVSIEEAPHFLVALSAPAFLLPTTTRGIVSLHLLDELAPERARVMEHELENQATGLDEVAEEYGLTPESKVLLEFGQEVHIASLATLRVWSRRFAVSVGWNITPLKDDPRASARLNLFRADGENSIGAPGPSKRGRTA
jgi:hypothetical protein